MAFGQLQEGGSLLLLLLPPVGLFHRRLPFFGRAGIQFHATRLSMSSSCWSSSSSWSSSASTGREYSTKLRNITDNNFSRPLLEFLVGLAEILPAEVHLAEHSDCFVVVVVVVSLLMFTWRPPTCCDDFKRVQSISLSKLAGRPELAKTMQLSLAANSSK